MIKYIYIFVNNRQYVKFGMNFIIRGSVTRNNVIGTLIISLLITYYRTEI